MVTIAQTILALSMLIPFSSFGGNACSYYLTVLGQVTEAYVDQAPTDILRVPAAVSEDHSLRAVALSDGKILIWRNSSKDSFTYVGMREAVRLTLGTNVSHLDPGVRNVRAMLFTPDGAHLLLVAGKEVSLWGLDSPVK